MAFDKFSAEQWVGALRGDEQDFMRQGDGKSSREKHPAVARVGGQSQQSSCMKWPPTCRLRREAGATEMERMKDTLWMCDVKTTFLPVYVTVGIIFTSQVCSMEWIFFGGIAKPWWFLTEDMAEESDAAHVALILGLQWKHHKATK